MKFYGFLEHGQLDQERLHLWSFRLDWTKYNRLSLEDGPNPTFRGPIDHGHLDQEKLDLDHGPNWSPFFQG
jgi:hypothetical protein